METLLETDSRRRISLAKLGVEANSYYLAERRADGAIVLTPAEVRPKVLDDADRIMPGWRDRLVENAPAEPSETWTQIKAEIDPDT